MSTARYGDAVYGAAGLVYGPALRSDRRLSWGLDFDWDGDGIFTGENELVGLFDLEVENGRTFILSQGQDAGFEPIGVGRVVLMYRNVSGRYDPYNSEGPLYGLLQTGRLFRLRVVDEATGTIHPVMVGRVADIRPVYGDVEAVKITCENLVRDMKAAPVRTGVYVTERYDDALEALLAAAGWGFGSDIDSTVSEAMPYWWASGGSLFAEIHSLVDAALGLFCIGEDGKAVYRSRVSTDAPLVDITGLDVEREYGIQTPSPQEAIRNRARVYSRTRIPHAAVELWRLSDVAKIPAGGSREIWGSFSYGGVDAVASAVTTPVAATDYTANAAAGGGGADLTSQMALSMDVFASSAKLTVTNLSAGDMYITLLKLRGDAIVADQYTFVEDSDAGSIGRFGDLAIVVSSDWLQDVNSARDEARLLVQRLSEARRYPRVTLKPNPAIQFGLRMFGLAELAIASKRISGEFRLGYIKHKWVDEVGQLVRTEAFFEPNLLSNTSGTWVFPATFDVTTIF